jgi:hypothetical protein
MGEISTLTGAAQKASPAIMVVIVTPKAAAPTWRQAET